MEYEYIYESPYEHLPGDITFPEHMRLDDYGKYYKARKMSSSEMVKDWSAVKAIATINIEHDTDNPPLELVIFASKCLNKYMIQYLSPN